MPHIASKHERTGCIDGYLPVSPIDRRPSDLRCPECEAETTQFGDPLDDEATQHRTRVPGPWHVEPAQGRPSVRTLSGSIIAVAPGCTQDAVSVRDFNPITRAADEANAAFIVRACNNHEKLVEALEQAAAALYKAGADWADSMALDAAREARAAIAAARGDA